MIMLDVSIITVAIPSIIDGLQASLAQVLWVLNAYTMVYAVLMMTSARLGDLAGTRTLYLLGLGAFTVASALCGFAHDPNQLIAARSVQGVGAALLTPQTMTIITNVFPPNKRGAAFGVWGAVAGAAGVIGLTLGGLIVTAVGWRWVFFVNIPVGVVDLLCALILIPNLRGNRHHRFDVPGVVIATLGLFGLLFGLIEGQSYNWGPVLGALNIWEIIGVGVVLLAGFVIWEHFQVEPLMPSALFRLPNFSQMNAVMVLVVVGVMGVFLPFMIYLQSVLNLTPLQAGLAIAPMGLTQMLAGPISGRLADRIGGRFVLAFGLLMSVVGLGLVVMVASVHTHWYNLIVPMTIMGLGMGSTWPSMISMAMAGVGGSLAGAASGVFNTTRVLGFALAGAVVGALLQNQLATSLTTVAGRYSQQLPQELRAPFVSGFRNAAASGLKVGRGQAGSSIPHGLPHQLVGQLEVLSRQVFTHAYVQALRPTLELSLAAMALAMLFSIPVRSVAVEQIEAKEEMPVHS